MAKKIESWKDIREYCFDRLAEIRRINDGHPCPSAFVCIAAFIGFLSRLAYGTNNVHDGDHDIFMKFVKNFMPTKYACFGSHTDLMYFTFRCGIVHAMSFDPGIMDKRIGREAYLNSVGANLAVADLAISHSDELSHLCAGENILRCELKDGAQGPYVLVASVLCDDIRAAIEKMFDEKEIQDNSEGFVKVQRLITGAETHPIPASVDSSTVSLSGSWHGDENHDGYSHVTTTAKLSGEYVDISRIESVK